MTLTLIVDNPTTTQGKTMKKSYAVLLVEADAKIVDMSNIIAAKDAEIEKLKKELESKKSSYDYLDKAKRELTAEIDALHAVFNDLPGAPPQRVKSESYPYDRDLNLMTRFAGFLASKLK